MKAAEGEPHKPSSHTTPGTPAVTQLPNPSDQTQSSHRQDTAWDRKVKGNWVETGQHGAKQRFALDRAKQVSQEEPLSLPYC